MPAKGVRKDLLAKQLERGRTKKTIPSRIQFGLPAPLKSILQRLTFIKAPTVLMAAVFLLMMANSLQTQWLDSLETFAGKHEVTKALRRAGFSCVAFELEIDSQNMNLM